VRDIKPYHERITKIIRDNANTTLIIAGTPHFRLLGNEVVVTQRKRGGKKQSQEENT